MAASRRGFVALGQRLGFMQQEVAMRLLPGICGLHTSPSQHNSNRTSIVRCGRQVYNRTYPVLLIRPDGSAITIRYKEPRKILEMPVDIVTLSDAERRARFRKRNPKPLQSIEEEEFEDEFKLDDYSKFWKKK